MLRCLGAQTRRLARRQAVLLEGDPAEYLGIVLQGAVEVLRDDFYGNRSLVARIGPMQLFAETFACAQAAAMPVSVVAACESEVLLLDCRRVLQGCANACGFHSRVVSNLLQVVAAKNLLLNQKLELVSRRTTREKLMAYLLLQAKQQGGPEFTIPLNRQGLADYLEVDRSAMSAELSRLRRDGWVEYRKNWFRILK